MWVDYEQLEKRFVASYFDGEAGSIGSAQQVQLGMFQVVLGVGCARCTTCRFSRMGVVIAAISLMTRLLLPDLTKNSSVRAIVKELVSTANHVPKPQTISTRRVIVELLTRVLPSNCHGYLLGRWNFQLIVDMVGGLRVGETTGNVHGLLANDVQDGVTGQRFVNMKISDSKTGFPRYISLVAETSVSHVMVFEAVERLAGASG